jgi:hypothetical protein
VDGVKFCSEIKDPPKVEKRDLSRSKWEMASEIPCQLIKKCNEKGVGQFPLSSSSIHPSG